MVSTAGALTSFSTITGPTGRMPLKCWPTAFIGGGVATPGDRALPVRTATASLAPSRGLAGWELLSGGFADVGVAEARQARGPGRTPLRGGAAQEIFFKRPWKTQISYGI
jgi:hypothetical protein